ncbi:uncharacterized protein LOC141724020 [Apium graveolens]|uniref:uncharacterized protein LOC141724020 n=1 Tax=Apium graveolens TaxID=4045 RepID=UPI003D7B8109
METNTLFAKAIAGDADAISQLEIIADQLSNDDRTILHIACMAEKTEQVQFILTKFANKKNLLVKLDKYKQTALHLAAARGHTEVVEILIDAARRSLSSSDTDDPHSPVNHVEDFFRQANYMGNTALHQAVTSNNVATVEQLVKADPNDRHIQNLGGFTPVYLAAKSGYNDIVKIICNTCTAPSLIGPEGTTALHAAISQLHEAGKTDKDIVMVLMDSAKRSFCLKDTQDNNFQALFDRTDQQHRTLLSLAVLKNHPDVVKLILKEDPAYGNVPGTKKNGLKSLISIASRYGYKDIVKILCEKYETGKTDHAGHVLLIEAIKGGEKEFVFDLLKYDENLVTYETFAKWTALHYAAFHNFDSIIEAILEAGKNVDYKPVYGASVETPLIIAAKKGYTSTVILLMKSLPDLSCLAVNHEHQNILHIAVVQSNKDMIQSILAHCPKSCTNQILNGKDGNSNTPLHLLISHGCFVTDLITHKGVDVMAKNNQNWTPLDMLYSQDKVTAEQVRIKKLLDDTQATQHRKFWPISIKGASNDVKSSVPSSTRSLKDAAFKIHIKEFMKQELAEMKEELRRYRERTTTQIIVTALITTVTFTVGFTMPGGYHQSGEPEEGLVLLSNKKAFKIFMISDALALALSITSLFIYFISSLYDNPSQVSKFDAASTGLNIVSVMAMILTFIAGVHVVLSHSPGLAMIVCIICSTFFISITVLLIKTMCDCRTSRKLKV